MPRIKSRLDTASPEFRANAEHHRALVEDLRAHLFTTDSRITAHVH